MRLITEAGKQLLGLGGKVAKRFGNNIGQMGKGELALNLAPDLVIGAMYGATTPGDTTDKVIAGLGSGLGGALGGVGLRAGLGVRNPIAGMAIDYGGSIVGDIGGQAVSDQVLRVKNGGMTPWEQLQEEQYLAMKAEAKEEVLRELMAREQQGGFF